MAAFVFVSLFHPSVLLLIMNFVIKKIALNFEKPYRWQWAPYTFVNTKNDQKTNQGRDYHLYLNHLRSSPNAAPLTCRIKLLVPPWCVFGATADSDGVLASNLIREARSNQFSMRKYVFWIQQLCPNSDAVTNISLSFIAIFREANLIARFSVCI